MFGQLVVKFKRHRAISIRSRIQSRLVRHYPRAWRLEDEGDEKRELGIEGEERKWQVHGRRENYCTLSTSIATRIRALRAPY